MRLCAIHLLANSLEVITKLLELRLVFLFLLHQHPTTRILLLFEALASNGLRDNTDWPKAVLVLPAAFIALWKKAITKSFINFNSGIYCRMNHGSYLGNWTGPLFHDKFQWWRSPLEDQLYKCNGNGNDWLLYVRRFGW